METPYESVPIVPPYTTDMLLLVSKFCLRLRGEGGGGGGGGGNLGIIVVQVFEPVFRNLPPFIYLDFEKTDPFIY